ncbi:hypothetical protein ACFC1R_28415 [Kitasatospora sp. NPDC056138]|uniref:hypothetical protein n=1 Tax=Kitasatospora sp. NPDC056138 TaxID=3345724 RepID=UPI0035D5F3D9
MRMHTWKRRTATLVLGAAAALALTAGSANAAANAATASPHNTLPYACGYGSSTMITDYGISHGTQIDPGTTYCVVGYELVMQNDGNLVLYSENGAVWSSGTWGHGGAYAKFQDDGNLVVYASPNSALWNSGTWGHQNAGLYLRSNGHLWLLDANRGWLWNS